LHKYTFEMVGYDFMLVQGSQNKPFELRLIEANTNPCIEESNTLLRSYIPRMIDDMFKLVLDPLFNTVTTEFYKVEGYVDHENMWRQIDLI